jgi:hypothetical protein
LRKKRRFEDITNVSLYEIRNYFTRGTRKREKRERKKDHVDKKKAKPENNEKEIRNPCNRLWRRIS